MITEQNTTLPPGKYEKNTRFLPPEGLNVVPIQLINGNVVMSLFAPVWEDYYMDYFFEGSWQFRILKIEKKVKLKEK